MPVDLEAAADRVGGKFKLGQIGAVDADAQRLAQIGEVAVNFAPRHLPARPRLDCHDQRGGVRAVRPADERKAVQQRAHVGNAGVRQQQIARADRNDFRVVDHVEPARHGPHVPTDMVDHGRRALLETAVEPDLHESQRRGQRHAEQRCDKLAAIEQNRTKGDSAHEWTRPRIGCSRRLYEVASLANRFAPAPSFG
ncbi:MAG: hypothetical protein IPL03_00750 [Sterolibacteriaceae bacterium]|nr:hypothetical protein [Candidatus Methylophosphatis haderslevensis]